MFNIQTKKEEKYNIQQLANPFDGEQSDEMNHFCATKDITIKLFDRAADL